MKIDRWDSFFRWLITTLVFGFYIALVFFNIQGNWMFLLTFDYYFTTISSTSVSLLLRWIWSDKGVEYEIINNTEISEKQQSKDNQIQKITQNNLVDLLEVAINKANQEEKKKEYKTICDKKINSLKQKGWYKLFREKRLATWKQRKLECIEDEFNWDTVNIKYYKYDMDEMLCSFYKENPNNRKRRKSKNEKVINSTRTNLVTILVLAVLKGTEIFVSAFNTEDILVLLGQLIVFTMNISNGYKLGKGFIREDYSRNLSEDYVFLKTFLKTQGVN